MDFLIDTHVFLWWEWQSRELSSACRMVLSDAGNRFAVSAASIWEVSIKRNSGRLKFHGDLIEACAANAFELLPIAPRHAELAGSLPLHHSDPFDRMLVAQAMTESLVLLTQDRKMSLYNVPLLG